MMTQNRKELRDITAQLIHRSHALIAHLNDRDRLKAEWSHRTRSMGAYAVIDMYDETGEYVGTL